MTDLATRVVLATLGHVGEDAIRNTLANARTSDGTRLVSDPEAAQLASDAASIKRALAQKAADA